VQEAEVRRELVGEVRLDAVGDECRDVRLGRERGEPGQDRGGALPVVVEFEDVDETQALVVGMPDDEAPGPVPVGRGRVGGLVDETDGLVGSAVRLGHQRPRLLSLHGSGDRCGAGGENDGPGVTRQGAAGRADSAHKLLYVCRVATDVDDFQSASATTAVTTTACSRRIGDLPRLRLRHTVTRSADVNRAHGAA
jgi:hypothetical protein